MSDKKLIVGLGNPGKKYKETRHNLGALVVEGLGEGWFFPFKKKLLLKSSLATGEVKGNIIYLLLPETYMNLSGLAVRKALNYYNLPVSNLIVVVDDVELPFGKLRYRDKGSSGGHNGLKDIESHLGTQDFARLKMGIDSAKRREESLESYVLQSFTLAEKGNLKDFLAAGMEVVESWCEAGSLEAVKRVEKVNKKLAVLIERQADNYFDEER